MAPTLSLNNILFYDFKTFREIDFTKERVAKEIANEHLYTYSKYAEDRKEMWRNSYLKHQPEVIHLGRDIQIAVGTAVYCPIGGIIMDIWDDTDNNVGWGRRIDIYQPRADKYWIFGHLGRNHALEGLHVGRGIAEGDFLGRVGAPLFNGNVFPHIHLQVCDFQFTQDKDTRHIDGYGTTEILQSHFDPFNLLKLIS